MASPRAPFEPSGPKIPLSAANSERAKLYFLGRCAGGVRHALVTDPLLKIAARVAHGAARHFDEERPATPHAAAEPAPEPSDADVGAGVSLGVWVTGLLVAVLILIAIFAL